MKKLLGIVVLGLLWCNVGYTGIGDKTNIFECKLDVFNDFKKFFMYKLDPEKNKADIKDSIFRFKILHHEEKGVRVVDLKKKHWLFEELAQFEKNEKNESIYIWREYVPEVALENNYFNATTLEFSQKYFSAKTSSLLQYKNKLDFDIFGDKSYKKQDQRRQGHKNYFRNKKEVYIELIFMKEEQPEFERYYVCKQIK